MLLQSGCEGLASYISPVVAKNCLRLPKRNSMHNFMIHVSGLVALSPKPYPQTPDLKASTPKPKLEAQTTP